MTDLPTRLHAESLLDEIRQALAQSSDPKAIKGLHDQLTALMSEIKTSALGRDLMRCAAELKLRVERKAGEIWRV